MEVLRGKGATTTSPRCGHWSLVFLIDNLYSLVYIFGCGALRFYSQNYGFTGIWL